MFAGLAVLISMTAARLGRWAELVGGMVAFVLGAACTVLVFTLGHVHGAWWLWLVVTLLWAELLSLVYEGFVDVNGWNRTDVLEREQGIVLGAVIWALAWWLL